MCFHAFDLGTNIFASEFNQVINILTVFASMCASCMIFLRFTDNVLFLSNGDDEHLLAIMVDQLLFHL